MKDLNVIVYTMKGCPHCTEFKNMLKEKEIDFFDRDIEDYYDEYQVFVEVSKSSYIPALLIIEGDGDIHTPHIYVPESNYQTLEEAVIIVETHIESLNKL